MKEPQKCTCGNVVRIITNYCKLNCRQVQIICDRCYMRFGDWHFPVYPDGEENTQDAIFKLTQEWNKYVENTFNGLRDAKAIATPNEVVETTGEG